MCNNRLIASDCFQDTLSHTHILLNVIGFVVSWFLSRGQTLQYYRSQHEARPRDAINLSAPASGRQDPWNLEYLNWNI